MILFVFEGVREIFCCIVLFLIFLMVVSIFVRCVLFNVKFEFFLIVCICNFIEIDLWFSDFVKIVWVLVLSFLI